MKGTEKVFKIYMLTLIESNLNKFVLEGLLTTNFTLQPSEVLQNKYLFN